MSIQNIFYGVGIIFIFISAWWFSREFIINLPDEIKLLLLISSVIFTFVIAELFRGADK